jgi:phage N-6-adenine-methyltransferase
MTTSGENYATPDDFILAVKRRFRVLSFYYDLAAEPETTKGEHFFCEEENALSKDWTRIPGAVKRNLWLNPPFGQIAPWAAKCHDYGQRGTGRLFFLTPASVGANWFAEYVWAGNSTVYALQGRLSFDGKAPYPKDCMLTVFGAGQPMRSEFEVWDWRT